MNMYYKDLIDEIVEMIKINLELIYAYDEKEMIKIRKHCKKNIDSTYKSLPYNQLLCFTKEVISSIINAPYLYDFRNLE